MKYDARALKRILKEKQILTHDLAARAGLAPVTVIYMARGVTTPNVVTLAKVATALDVPITLFFETKEPAA